MGAWSTIESNIFSAWNCCFIYKPIQQWQITTDIFTMFGAAANVKLPVNQIGHDRKPGLSYEIWYSWHVMVTHAYHITWWRHQMETFSALLAVCAGNSPVPGEFPAQRPVTRSFDVSFDLRLNKRLSKQSWGWWLRRHRPHYDVIVMNYIYSDEQTLSLNNMVRYPCVSKFKWIYTNRQPYPNVVKCSPYTYYFSHLFVQ